jgi:O-antigen/teichoic acid export membrane protein
VIIKIASVFQKIIKHQGFNKYFFNSFWLILENILRLLAGLFVGIWVARYLGPEQFGLYSYVLAFTSIFTSIAKLGLDGIVIREIVKYPLKSEVVLGTAFWLKIVGAFIAIVLIGAAAKLTSNDSSTNWYVFIVSACFIFQSFEVIDFYYQANVLAKFVSLCKIVQLVLSSFVKIVLVIYGSTLFWFVLVALFDAITLAISLMTTWFFNNKKSFFLRFEFQTAKELLWSSFPLIVSGLIVMVYMRIDHILIKELLGVRELGIYSAAVRLSDVWNFVPVVICNSLFPALINAKKVSVELFEQRLQRLYSLMEWFAIIWAVFMFFFAGKIINILYGSGYAGAEKILQIQIWSLLFIAVSCVHGKWLLIEGLQKYCLLYSVTGMCVNIVANIFLIPRMGAVGASCAGLLAQVFPYVFTLVNKKTRSNLIIILRSFFFLNNQNLPEKDL